MRLHRISFTTSSSPHTMFSWLLCLSLLAFSIPVESRAQDAECGTVLTPEQIEIELAIDPSAYSQSGHKRGSAIIHYVPISFHVVRQSNGTGGLNEARQALALQDLNLRYEPVGIQFFRYRDGADYYVDYIDSDAFYTGTNNNSSYNLLRNTNPVANTANVWFCPNTGLCGLSSFPGPGTQGTIMDIACVAIPSNKSTFAHELGHYFHLFHTHETGLGTECPDGTNCLTAGDALCDTPADPNLSSGVGGGCTFGGAANPPFGCGGSYDPMVNNLMSYAPKACRDTFTVEQINKMIWSLETERPYLFMYDSSDNDLDGVMDVVDNCPESYNPDQLDADLDGFGDACLHAQIGFDSELGAVPHMVQFDGASDLVVESWSWDFGDGNFSTEQNPLHSYDSPGFRKPRLTVTTVDSFYTAQYLYDIVTVADTLIVPEKISESGESIRLDIYAHNTIEVSLLTLPFIWNGDFDVDYDSASVVGLRTEYFEDVNLISFDPFNKRANLKMVSSYDGGLPALAPDTGAIVSLYFTPAPGATGGSTPVTISDWGSAELYFITPYGTYQPTTLAGSISAPSFVCGDADGSGAVGIGDVTFLVNHIFSFGPPPDPSEAGDADGSGSLTIADVTYTVAHIFSGGLAPVCP